jgi:chromosome segregation ATPase
MPAFILLASALLTFAVTVQLLASGYQPAALIALFSSLPKSQQIAWVLICLVPLSLIVVAFVQYWKLREKNKAAEVLETRLRSARHNVFLLEDGQKNTEQAVHYLDQSDPEGAISTLQTRMASSAEAVQYHQQRNASGDLTGSVEQIRRQQYEIKQQLGDVIAKRRSLETSIAQLQSSQDEMEQAISVIEQDRTQETIERRMQKLSQFIGTTNTRCAEIERSIPGLLELEEKFAALQRRLAPLDAKETGINGVLRRLGDVRTRLAATIDRLEQDEGVSLVERSLKLTKTKNELEARVSSVLAQFSEIETLHKDITGLFIKLHQAQRVPRELDGGGRIVSLNG